jgi:hypothetical protein
VRGVEKQHLSARTEVRSISVVGAALCDSRPCFNSFGAIRYYSLIEVEAMRAWSVRVKYYREEVTSPMFRTSDADPSSASQVLNTSVSFVKCALKALLL